MTSTNYRTTTTVTVEDRILAIHVLVTAKEVAAYCNDYQLCELEGPQLYVFNRNGELVHHQGTGSDSDKQGYNLAVKARAEAIRKLHLTWPAGIIKPKSTRTVQRERTISKVIREPAKRRRPRRASTTNSSDVVNYT